MQAKVNDKRDKEKEKRIWKEEKVARMEQNKKIKVEKVENKKRKKQKSQLVKLIKGRSNNRCDNCDYLSFSIFMYFLSYKMFQRFEKKTWFLTEIRCTWFMVFRYLFSFFVATHGHWYDNYIPYTFEMILIYIWSLQVI